MYPTREPWPPRETDYGGSTQPGVHHSEARLCYNDYNTDGINALWDCWGGANQQWTHTATGELTVYSGGSPRCLDADGAGSANGTRAIIWTCHGGANRRWNLDSNGTITNVQSGLCLDVSGYGTAKGSQLHLWACLGGSNQQWALR